MFARFLAHTLTPELVGKWLISHYEAVLNQSAVARWQMAKKGKEKIEGEWKINLGVEKPKKGKELISRIFRAEKTHAKNNLARGNMRFSSLSRAEGT